MGKYDFRPTRVLPQARLLIKTKRINASEPPPWMRVVEDVPPSAILNRPVFRDARTISDEENSRTRFGRASRAYPRLDSKLQDRNMKQIFKPLQMGYNEDKLRSDFFNDHPWELARPKVILEDSGNDAKNWDWSTGIKQPGKRLDGERYRYSQFPKAKYQLTQNPTA